VDSLQGLHWHLVLSPVPTAAYNKHPALLFELRLAKYRSALNTGTCAPSPHKKTAELTVVSFVQCVHAYNPWPASSAIATATTTATTIAPVVAAR
jgi:hypothetical protein